MRIAGICSAHGYWKGECCSQCAQEKTNQTFYTSKDKLWDFVDVNTTGKPIYFTSKGKWKAHLKRLGLHDDIKQSNRTEKDFMKPPKSKYTAQDYAKDIWSELKERGLNDKVVRR